MHSIRQRLAREVKALERELRIEIPAEIRSAVAMGDLRENAEYKAALERQAYVKARIGQLRERLAALGSLQVRDLPADRVALGTTVKLLDVETDEELTYDLVFPELADSARGLISVASPVGRALLGRSAGDLVAVTIPRGTRRFEILDVRTVHDKQSEESA